MKVQLYLYILYYFFNVFQLSVNMLKKTVWRLFRGCSFLRQPSKLKETFFVLGIEIPSLHSKTRLEQGDGQYLSIFKAVFNQVSSESNKLFNSTHHREHESISGSTIRAPLWEFERGRSKYPFSSHGLPTIHRMTQYWWIACIFKICYYYARLTKVIGSFYILYYLQSVLILRTL